jgi:hypothetical protein
MCEKIKGAKTPKSEKAHIEGVKNESNVALRKLSVLPSIFHLKLCK